MWCPDCRQDVAFSGEQPARCRRCGRTATSSTTTNSAPLTLPSNQAWQAELRRVQRMVRNVDRLLADQPVTPPRNLPKPSSAESQTPAAEITEPFVDPTRTLTWPEMLGMFSGLIVMVGSLVLSALLFQGQCSTAWAIVLGLVVCCTTGMLLLFWQRIEQQQRDLLLLERHLRKHEHVDSHQLLAGMHAELDRHAQRVQ